jgi:hypothetical protein
VRKERQNAYWLNVASWPGLLAACLLVSTGLSPEAAFGQLTQARGCPVPETSEQRQWVEGFAPELVAAGAGHKF